MFARFGYRVPVRKLASELGVTTGALYHHFGSKDEMFLAVLRASVAADSQQFPDLPPSITPEDRVRLLIHSVRARESYLTERLLVLGEYLRHEGGRPTAELADEMDQYAVRVGRLLGSDDPALGTYVLSLINGVLWRRYLDGGRTRWEDIERMLVASIDSLSQGGKLPAEGQSEVRVQRRREPARPVVEHGVVEPGDARTEGDRGPERA